MIRAALPALLLVALTGPAFADPNCLQRGDAGLRVDFGFRIGDFTEQDDMDFLLLEARGRGIYADSAERTWLNCIKITRREGSRWVTEYYDPDTWALVE